jgi:hypothetical protein
MKVKKIIKVRRLSLKDKRDLEAKGIFVIFSHVTN